MKTNYFNSNPKFLYSVMGLLGLLVTSCGSYQNTSYNDNDGIYDNGTRRNSQSVQNTTPSNGYKEYFGSLQDNNDVVVFTDVDNYRTAQDTMQDAENRGYDSGYAGWGGDTENVTVNVYGNNWGFSPWQNWYGPSWGWGWNTGWGFNGWYGPAFNNGWGWNNWYGPGFGFGFGWDGFYGNGFYGNGYSNNQYSYNNGIRGVRNEMYGSRNNVGRRYDSATRSNNYSTSRRSTISNGTRSTQFSNSRSAVRNNPGTRSQNYTPGTRSNSRSSNYSPSSSGGSRSYSPSSSGGSRSSGGGSYGGGGGGRSGGGGGGRR